MTGAGTPARRRFATSAALAAAGVLLLALAAAADEPEVPADSDPTTGLPAWVPREFRDPAAVRDWAGRAAAAGRARAGTALGGDLLHAAGDAVETRLFATDEAATLYEEAAAAYPGDDPTSALARLHAARLRAAQGDFPSAQRLLEGVVPWRRVGAPSGVPSAAAVRWRLLGEALRWDLPNLETSLHEAHGRLDDAALVVEGMARDHAVSGSTRRGRSAAGLFERAARLRARAGRRDEARADIDEAIRLSTDEREIATWSFWRLYLEHGLLAPDGAMALIASWPGEAFADGIRAVLRGLAGNPRAGEFLLSAASGATLAGNLETAHAIYALALTDRDLAARAHRTPDLWRGLLAAFPVAVRLERFDEADAILDAVARVAGEPIPEMDAYRVLLLESRARAKASADPVPPAPTPRAPPPAPAPAPGPRGTLNVPDSGGEPSGGRVDEGSAPEDGAGPGVPFLVLLACLAAALLVLLVRRRGRGG